MFVERVHVTPESLNVNAPQCFGAGIRPTNPADAVETPRPEEKEMQPIDEDRAVLLIESAENTEMYIPILTGLCTGLRRGELLPSAGPISTWTTPV